MNRRSAEDTRRIINDAALTVFAKSGYEGANMRMIAAEAGISVGALYLYHRSKEELCATVFRGLFKEFRREITQKVLALSDPLEQIRAYIGTYMEMAKTHREFIYTFNRERGFTFGVEWKRGFFAELRALLDLIVKRGVEQGVFAEVGKGEATKVLMSVLRGYVVSIVIDPENLFSAGACADILLKGLVKRCGPEERADSLR